MFKNLLSLLPFFFSYTLFAADIFVDQSASTGGDGSTWTLAFQTIEEAVAAAADGDTIFIAEGIYRPQSTIQVSVPLNFRGGYPAGGGVQNIDVNNTQIQADFDTGNLLYEVFDINPGATTNLTGLRFFNCRRAISSAANLTINQLQFEQVSVDGINLQGTFDFCTIENSLFTNISGDMIAGFSVNLQNINISKTIFQNGTARAINLGDDLVNFTMNDCVINNFNNSTASIALDNTTAVFNNLLAENNVSASGAIIFFRDSNVTITQSLFNNNSGEGTLCLQGSDSQLNLIASNFTNNSSISTFPKPVMGMRDVLLTATDCLFENNYAEGSQPDAVGEIRGDDTNPLITFENCDFINNTSIGSITSILDISYGSSPFINNCIFDGNTSDTNNAINSFNSTGAVITNNTFKNHTTDEALVFVSNGGAGYDVILENNKFFNNNFTTIGINRFDNLTMTNNSFIGEDILLDIWQIPNVDSTNDYFNGNTTRTEFIEFDEVTVDINNMVMISTATSGSHTLVDSGDNTALRIVNSTFSSSNIDDTNVRIHFNDDLTSRLRNSIIWSGNNNLTQSGLTGDTGNLAVRYSLVKGENPSGAGNLNGTQNANTPRFIDPSDNDFRMLNCSPTVNVGLNSYSSQPQDILGNDRVFETNIDLGAYELQIAENTSCATATAPSCTTLIGPGPTDGDNGVNLNPTIYWTADPDAIGYILRVGTALGSSDLINERLGNQTSYGLTNLPEDAPIFVRIVPFNGTGNAPGCVSERFDTESLLGIPTCTYLTSPANEDAITPNDLTNITWNAVSNADGYRVTISGSSSSANNETNLVVNGTSHNFANDFNEGETVTVTIRPFNDDGIASCTADTFTIIAAAITPPACTTLTSPTGNDVAIGTTQMTWDAVTDATGYRITITGTSNNNVTDVEVTTNNFTFPGAFVNGETAAVTIIPFNGSVNATGCTSETFTIEAATAPTTPTCTNLTSPTGTNVALGTTQMTWDAVTDATGYRITISGTTNNNVTDVEVTTNNFTFPGAFVYGETATVTLIPFNGSVNATGCTSETFTVEAAGPVGNGFITTWQTTTANETITIPTTGGGYNYTVDWGDGNITVGEVGNAVHTYTNPGIYTVSITGDFPRIFFNSDGDREKILTIEQWGNIEWTSMDRAFFGCRNLDITNTSIDAPNLTNVTNMMSTFGGCTNFNGFISNWNVSNITNMASTFNSAISFNRDISGWDVNNVTRMDQMFRRAESFNQNIGNWSVGNTADMENMFSDAISFDQNLGNWNIINVTNMEEMFEGVTLSVSNYDALLMGWNSQNLQPNVTFSGGNSQYCAGASARTIMTGSDNWTVTDGGLAGPTVDDLADQTQANSYTLPAITGTQLTGGEAYYTDANGGGTSFDAGDTINFTDFTSYPITIYIYDGSGSCASEESFELTLTSTTPRTPACTSLISPTGNDIPVGTTEMTWNTVADATGYRITIAGTANNNVTNFETTSTDYTFTGAFVNGETATVAIVPFNGTINANGCADETFTIDAATPTPPDCTSLTAPGPVNNDTDVAVDVPSISWNSVNGAAGYKIAITSASGSNDLPLTDMNNTLTHPFAVPFQQGDIVIVTIIPYNAAGDATGPCIDETFTITSNTQLSIPSCSFLTSPTNDQTDVPVNPTIVWEEVDNTEGYRLAVRTELNEIILEDEDVGLLTSFTLSEDLPYGTLIYVTITPYNAQGQADSCIEQSFTTRVAPEEPLEPEEPIEEDETKYGFSPDGDGINEFWEIDNIEDHPVNVVTIFNRWGDAVFRINNYDNVGSVFRGEANLKTKMGAGTLPAGTYFFNIQIEGASTLKKTQGYLVLKR